MKRLPAGVRFVRCLAAVALALQSFAAGADHGKNHYILDCERPCATAPSRPRRPRLRSARPAP